MSALSQCIAHIFNKDKNLDSLGVEINRQIKKDNGLNRRNTD